MNLHAYPKVELHLHLDVSLSYEVVHVLDPTISPERYRRDFLAPAKCPNLMECLSRASSEVVSVVEAATTEASRDTGVEARVLLCTLRHFTAKQSMQTVRLVEQFQGTSVVGFDLAGDEAGFALDAHLPAFHYARTRGIAYTAHAGEAKGAESVWDLESAEHLRTLRRDRPYERLNITEIRGVTEAQKASLRALGAKE